MALPQSYRAAAAPGPVHRLEGHERAIASSHERCQAFGLNPQMQADLSRLDKASLQELQQRNARLCAQALPVMDMLYEQLSHGQSMVLLTDASGVILHARGDAGFLERARQVALAPGAQWAEASKGTNAVGTALMTERPTLVHGQEHYLRGLQFLTCSAAPIFDHKGALLGVIDVSGDRRSYHPHTLALAATAARLIENQWFSDRFRRHLRLHFHPSTTGLGTLHEGVLVLADDGRVMGANRRALEMMDGAAMALRRESMQSLFDTPLGPLLDQMTRQPELPLLLNLRRSGQAHEAVHALLSPQAPGQCPVAAQGSELAPDFGAALHANHRELADLPGQPGPSALPGIASKRTLDRFDHGVTLRDAELKAIRLAVQGCGGNLSLAARQLGIGRSTLYRKLKAGGMVA